ncbi:hypothetical protein FOZ62_000641 [Perkinsus olseni]|uniref:Uncharacterized protein n=1 Tax=Perkinsus olseni TaxID=32597 RepID=A0A7J6R290_PEROL|nr:hypothetical protein FOZ62_000641 [Perkinsus olseni]
MPATSKILLPILSIVSVVAQLPNQSNPPAFEDTNLSPLVPIVGGDDVDSVFKWLTAQMRDGLSSLASDHTDLPPAVASMEEDWDSLAINSSVILPVLAKAVENGEDPFYVSLAFQIFTNSSNPITDLIGPSQPLAIQAPDYRPTVWDWLVNLILHRLGAR